MSISPISSIRRDTSTTGATATTSGSATTSGAAATTSTPAGGDLGQDAFMKLLIAQMQNQDPTSPMDGTQMATQLATFSSLSQLQDINATLTSQQSSNSNLLGAVQATSAINTIGHTVVADGNQVQIGGANPASSVMADVAAPGGTGTLTIYNSAGTAVGSRSLGAVAAGTKQSFDLGSAADGLPAGTYTYGIDVKDSGGNASTVQTYMSGKIDGVSTSQNGIVLTSGGLSIPYASVVQIIN
jgi:flagellar basal-body rod modification protein FlgD